MFQIKQSEATAARRRIPVLFVSSTDGFTPVTPTSPAAYISANGATWTATTNAVAVATLAAGQSLAGVYYIELTAAEVANLGWITVNIQATNARQYNAQIQIMAYDPYDVVRIGLTSIPNVAQGTTGAIATGNATGQVTVATNNDKTGYALSGTQTFNMTGSITGSLSGSVGSVTGAVGSVTGSVGSVTGSVASVTGSVGSVTGAVGSVTGNVGGNVTGSVGSLTATAVQNIWDDTTSSLTVVGSVGKLIVDNLNATVSSRSTLTDTQVWAAATRTLSAGTNIVLAKGTGITGFNDITVNNIWSETLPGAYTATQAGFKLNAAGSSADPWSTTLPGAYTAGTAGNIIGNRLDAAVSTRMATFTLPTNFSALTISVGGAVTAGTVSDKTGYSLAASQTFSTTGSIGSVTGSVGSVTGGVTVATNNDKTGYSLTTAPLSAGQTASAVWDSLLASYTVNNSFGQRVLRSTTAQSSCAVTGANHIAADVHELQPAVITAADFAANAIDANALAATAVTEIQTGLATSTDVSNVAAVTTKLNTTLQVSGAVYQFTTNALALAPTGGGPGGGSTTIVANGPYSVIADGLGANDALDIQQSTAQTITLRCVDGNGSGIPLFGATLSVIVYNAAGTAVATYTGTIAYSADGWLTFDLTTAVTATVGTYTVIVRRTTSATDISVYGPLRMYVRGI